MEVYEVFLEKLQKKITIMLFYFVVNKILNLVKIKTFFLIKLNHLRKIKNHVLE